ncbi:MAG: T9SS type A sorting domain-containing protein, partial [Salibacteraceae bacterium]
DMSGWAVSMSDSNMIAIGAPGNDGNGNAAGHVRIFRWNDSTWVQKGSDIDSEALGDEFGCSVNLPDSNTLAIGAPYNDGNGNDAGHVRIYSWNGSSWQQKGSDIDGEAVDDMSGFSVCMSDSNMLAIGGIENDGNSRYNVGHVRVFRWNGNVWQQKGADIDGEASTDYLGWSVGMPDSNTLAVGGIRNDGNGKDAGHVQVYLLCFSTSIISPLVCDSYTSPSSKYSWTSSSTYVDTIPNAEGCDSIITINLTILNSSSGVDVVTSCDSFTWINNVTYTSSTNLPTFTLINSLGCDSLVTLDLTITQIDTAVFQSNDSLFAVQSGATYQWLNCDSSFQVISGATNQTFVAAINGNYACEISLNGCIDTTTCTSVVLTTLSEALYQKGIKIYPNPVGDFLSVEIGSLVQNANIRIRNVNGQLVYESSNLHEGNNQIDFSNWTKGVYFVRIIGDDFDWTVKIVKQ